MPQQLEADFKDGGGEVSKNCISLTLLKTQIQLSSENFQSTFTPFHKEQELKVTVTLCSKTISNTWLMFLMFA